MVNRNAKLVKILIITKLRNAFLTRCLAICQTNLAKVIFNLFQLIVFQYVAKFQNLLGRDA